MIVVAAHDLGDIRRDGGSRNVCDDGTSRIHQTSSHDRSGGKISRSQTDKNGR
jgi:hypothetical protein